MIKNFVHHKIIHSVLQCYKGLFLLAVLLVSCSKYSQSEKSQIFFADGPSFGYLQDPFDTLQIPVFIVDSTWTSIDQIESRSGYFYSAAYFLKYKNKQITFPEFYFPFLSSLPLHDAWSSEQLCTYEPYVSLFNQVLLRNVDSISNMPQFLIFTGQSADLSDSLSYFFASSFYPGGLIGAVFEYERDAGLYAGYTISWKEGMYGEMQDFDKQDLKIIRTLLSFVKPVLNDDDCSTHINDGLWPMEYFVYNNEAYHLDYLGCQCFWGQILLTYFVNHPKMKHGNSKEKSEEILRRKQKGFPELKLVTYPRYPDFPVLN